MKKSLTISVDRCAETCTAPFRAPELFDVLTGATIDERTDVWSLGCTLFNLVFYQMPFDGTATAAVSGRIPFPAGAR
jgi:serine/threonine kinase 16